MTVVWRTSPPPSEQPIVGIGRLAVKHEATKIRLQIVADTPCAKRNDVCFAQSLSILMPAAACPPSVPTRVVLGHMSNSIQSQPTRMAHSMAYHMAGKTKKP